MGFDVKITTNFNVLDLLAPFSCRGCGALGSLLCERCKKHNIREFPEICPRCRKNLELCSCEVPVVMVSYREGVMARLVEDYKYQSIRATASVLAELMAESLKIFESDEDKDNTARAGSKIGRKARLSDEVVVVPLPTISRHVRERGFDHTLLLAKKLARIKKWKVARILERHNNTVQVGASEDERKKQAKGAYSLAKKFRAGLGSDGQSGKDGQSGNVTYLLIDDVWTTGASMEAAIKVMHEAGAKKIVGAVLLAPTDSAGQNLNSDKNVRM